MCTWLRSKIVKCSSLRRGLLCGGVIMVTLIARLWKVDTFLISYSKARACPIYHPDIPTVTLVYFLHFWMCKTVHSIPSSIRARPVMGNLFWNNNFSHYVCTQINCSYLSIWFTILIHTFIFFNNSTPIFL